MMIIEDKTALDSLANAIIGANQSVTDESATKSKLTKMIGNIIPEKSKFSSGVVIPATNITTSNMPEIPFNLGYDENGKLLEPDMIIIYQPQSITEGTNKGVQGNFLTLFFPALERTASVKGTGIYINKLASGNSLIGASLGSSNSDITRLTDTSFFLAPRLNFSWQAQMPIVWLQIKF